MYVSQLLRVRLFVTPTSFHSQYSTKNYTQNIDTLENRAGVEKVLQCHGSFATASCLQCRQKVPGKEIEADILSQKVPLCRVCSVAAVPAAKGKAKKSKKKARGEWDSDVEDESDEPEYPPGVMKVILDCSI